MKTPQPLVFNGINGTTGRYLLDSLTREDLARRCLDSARPVPVDETERVRTRGLAPGVDPRDLATSGWGVLFARGTPPEVRKAVRRLLAHRRRQAGRTYPRYYREYCEGESLRPGEDGWQWLSRHGAGPGPIDPARLPLYLLLVGDPQSIPFEVQFQLATHLAVGRLCFDTPEEYQTYARSVVDVETNGSARATRAAFFGVHNADDRATEAASEHLVKPLLRDLCKKTRGWRLEALLGERATRERLARLLGEENPSLLFTASHGMGFDADDPRQREDLGALLCGDWPGPVAWQGRIPEDFYFAATDLPREADLRGLISFHFACHSLGRPRLDSFFHQTGQPRVCAPRDLLARLPQRLLGHPAGSALAVIGHIDRAWGFSFLWPDVGAQPEAITAALQNLLEGWPVGWAARRLAERADQISQRLSSFLLTRAGPPPTATTRDIALADLWTAYIDARSYMVFGDPAVRLESRETGAPC